MDTNPNESRDSQTTDMHSGEAQSAEEQNVGGQGTGEQNIGEQSAETRSVVSELPIMRVPRTYKSQIAPMRLSAGSKLLLNTFNRINRTRPWYKLPTWLALLNFIALRTELRAKNLYDTNTLPIYDEAPAAEPPAAASPASPADP